MSRLVMSLEGEVTVREEEEEGGGGTELMGSTVTDGSYIKEKWEEGSGEDVQRTVVRGRGKDSVEKSENSDRRGR